MFQKSDIDDRVRANIVRIRNMRRLTQADLAKVANLPHLAQIESGNSPAGKSVLSKLANALQVDISEFFILPDADKKKKRVETLAQLFRSCSPGGQQIILAMARLISRYERRKHKKI